MANLFSIADFIEFMNLYLVLLDACFIALLVWFFAQEMWRERSTKLAAGLTVYLTGHIWIRGWTWYNWFYRTGSSWQQEPSQVIMFSIGLVITTLGLVLVLRQVMQAVNDHVWYVSVIGSAVLAIAVTWGT